MKLENFIWEPIIYEGFKETMISEIFVDNIYEKIFKVEENDIVVDIGASLGPFTYKILEKNPKHVFALEPSLEEFITLVKNTRHGSVTHINKGISNINGPFQFEHVFVQKEEEILFSLTFEKFISDYNLNRIDFLKVDCEGGEYDIFTVNNLFWIKNYVKKISGEWHLSNQMLKQRFREFRDVYLRVFPNYHIYTSNGYPIDYNHVWNESFIETFTEIMIFIDNR